MKYNVELMVKDDSDLIIELHFVNVDYQKTQGNLLISKELYADKKTICGFEEERVKHFSATLVEELKR